jgi:BirA family biotin operon repressor/biotin-[acetyl-CoA-carboxylase] ligase
MPATETFDLCAVEQSIAGTEFAGHLQHFASVPSTNELALQAAQSGARHGVWIADRQTAGRGRGSHIWHSPASDGLYMTALVAPAIPMQRALGLSFTTAIAVQSAIASVAGFRVRDQIDIRWPNDLLLNGKKCGGILIETSAQPAPASGPAMLRYAVVGIGINVNHTHFPPEIDAIATSLRRELPAPSRPLRREPLAAAILVTLDAELRRLTTDNLRPATCNVTQYSSWISGKRVRVEARDDDPGGYTGITAGLNPSGFLLVHGDDGQLHTVLSGGLREP